MTFTTLIYMKRAINPYISCSWNRALLDVYFI